MAYVRYEERYLLTLVASVVNQTKSPVPARRVDWGAVYRLADFHHVANVAYYGIMGIEGIPQAWRDRFFERYRESASRIEPMEKGEILLKEVFEQCQLPSVVLFGSQLRDLYPVREMSYVDRIEILADTGARAEVRQILEELDFSWRKSDEANVSAYYKIPGIQVCIREALPFLSKEIKRYFQDFLPSLLPMEDYEFVCEMPLEVEYIYRAARITERYATGDIEIRDLMDLWLLCKRYRERMDWDLIKKEAEGVIPEKFLVHIMMLMDIWFGKAQIPPDELDVFEGMENYILTKGEEGTEVSAKLLPLMKKVADTYQRNRKKEAFRKQVLWLFPEYEYMVGLYPVLETAEILLPLYWILRLLRTLVNWITGIIMKKTAPVRTVVIRMIKGLWGKISGAGNKLKEYLGRVRQKVKEKSSAVIAALKGRARNKQ